MRCVRVRALAMVVAQIAQPTSAHAQAAPARSTYALTYVLEGKAVAAECPNEAGFRDLMATRLGYDPFLPAGENSDEHVRVRMTKSGREFIGKLDLEGTARGARSFTAGNCDELASSVSFAIVVAIDPIRSENAGIPKAKANSTAYQRAVVGPGALQQALARFGEREINLTKIESRSSVGGGNDAWEYMFFVELVGHATDRHVLMALDDLRRQTRFCKVLGSYAREA
jgi:ACT domain